MFSNFPCESIVNYSSLLALDRNFLEYDKLPIVSASDKCFKKCLMRISKNEEEHFNNACKHMFGEAISGCKKIHQKLAH